MNVGKMNAFIGYGNLGIQIESFVKENDSKSLFFDDMYHNELNTNSFPFNQYDNETFRDLDFYVCLGYRHLSLKAEIIEKLISLRRNLPVFIHQTSFVNTTSFLEPGTIIYPMCNIDRMVVVGKGSLINNSVIISHNSVIGQNSYISPSVCISGNVKVGNQTFIGSGSTISNGVCIGDNVIVGVGSVITKDIPDGFSVIGNPQKKVEKINLI